MPTEMIEDVRTGLMHEPEEPARPSGPVRLCVGCRRRDDRPHADWCPARAASPEAMPGGLMPEGYPYAAVAPCDAPDCDPRLIEVESETKRGQWYECFRWKAKPGELPESYCSCPDFEIRGQRNQRHRCKHVRWLDAAGELPADVRRVSRLPDGSLVNDETGEQLAYIPVADPEAMPDEGAIKRGLADLADIDCALLAVNARFAAAEVNRAAATAELDRRRKRILAGFAAPARAFLDAELERMKARRKPGSKAAPPVKWKNPEGPGFLRRKTIPAKVVVTGPGAMTWAEAFAPELIVKSIDTKKLDPAKVMTEEGAVLDGFSIEPERTELVISTGIKTKPAAEAVEDSADG